MDRPDKLVKKYGVLRILRKGLSVDDAHFTLFYVYPLQNSMYWPIAPPTRVITNWRNKFRTIHYLTQQK